MHDYPLTGRAETDRCLQLANQAHRYYFSDALRFKREFVAASKEFFEGVEHKFISKYGGKNLSDSLAILFRNNRQKFEFFRDELHYVKKRLDILDREPNLINESTRFVLDHTARFIETILPYACAVKQEVEQNSKFRAEYQEIMGRKMTFFSRNFEEAVSDPYLSSFYANAWRSQRSLNGIFYLKQHFSNSVFFESLFQDPVMKEYYRDHGPDYSSALIFARMANEQFMKYQSEKLNLYQDNDDREISMPKRIDDVRKGNAINRLVALEAKLVHKRGNNIAHQGIPGFFSTCYHCLELLNYYNKQCIPS